MSPGGLDFLSLDNAAEAFTSVRGRSCPLLIPKGSNRASTNQCAKGQTRPPGSGSAQLGGASGQILPPIGPDSIFDSPAGSTGQQPIANLLSSQSIPTRCAVLPVQSLQSGRCLAGLSRTIYHNTLPAWFRHRYLRYVELTRYLSFDTEAVPASDEQGEQHTTSSFSTVQ